MLFKKQEEIQKQEIMKKQMEEKKEKTEGRLLKLKSTLCKK